MLQRQYRQVLDESWEGKGPAGRKLATFLKTVARILNNASGFGGMRVQTTPAGLHVYPPRPAYRQCFDLCLINDDNFGLDDPEDMAQTLGCMLWGRAADPFFSFGTNVSQISSPSDWPNDYYKVSSVDGARYVYLEYSHSGSTTTIKADATGNFSHADDDLSVVPLWYVGWDSTNSRIDTRKIVDLRNLPLVSRPVDRVTSDVDGWLDAIGLDTTIDEAGSSTYTVTNGIVRKP